MTSIYLDHAATSPLRPAALEAMLPVLGAGYGNPSSAHAWGRRSRAALDEARASLAELLGARESEIVFTRGGTEADNVAVLGRWRAAEPGAVLVCSMVEHSAVARSMAAAADGGATLHHLPVDEQGVVRLEGLDELLAARPALVSVMWVNNETGVIQPIAELAQRCQSAGVVFHTDAVQALGKVNVRVDDVPVDLLSLSAHKIGGPRGTGALFIRKGTELSPLLHGGGQERGFRPGTEDVAGAMSFAAAAQAALAECSAEMNRLRTLRNHLEAGLMTLPGVRINGAGADRSPAISHFSFSDVPGELLIPALDRAGVAASSGSACASGARQPSRVLLAMGVEPPLAMQVARFSYGWSTTPEEVVDAARLISDMIERLRDLAGAGSVPASPALASSGAER